MSNIFQMANITGGGFQDSSGKPLSLGKLVFQLSHDENISVLGGPFGLQIAAGRTITFYLDMNGNLTPNSYIWGNDALTPSGSYYLVKAYNSSGLQVWASPQNFFIQPTQPQINIGTLQPNQP